MTIETVPISTALGRAYLEDNVVGDCTLLAKFYRGGSVPTIFF